jgi:hypothetical protein
MAFVRLFIVILGAVALSGCCMSGSGCYVAKEGPLSAWDGRGTGPDDKQQPPEEQAMTSEQSMPAQQSKTRMARPKGEMIIGPITRARADAKAEGKSEAKSRSQQDFDEQQAADQEADAMLTKKLMICRDCMPSGRDAAAAGSAMR